MVPAAKPLILIVEDDIDIRESLSELLMLEGYEVAVAGNGKEALELLQHSAVPALILLDLMMPVMDGDEFRNEQLAQERLKNVPVVLMSADTKVAAKAIAMRSNGYLKKPVEVDSLLDTVSKHALKPA